MTVDGRDIALKVLYRVERDNAFAAAVLSSEVEKIADKREARLAYELVYGVLRTRPWLDTLLNRASERGLKKLSSEVMRALRLGAYQIAFLERVPAAAAVNHAVERIRRSRHSNLSGLVNALLRKLSKAPKGSLKPPSGSDATDADLAVRHGLPVWIVERMCRDHGRERALAMAAAFNRASRRTLRVNIGTLTRDAALRRLGKGASPGKLSPWSVDVEDVSAAQAAVEAGWAAYQDEAAQLSVFALDAGPKQRILDACAGRGGKTGALAMVAGGNAHLVAADRSPGKLDRLSFELSRQGFGAVTITADLIKSTDALEGTFDRILLDAPCSGTGTLGRRPEIRWRLKEDDVTALRDAQSSLLERCAARLAPGGRMVFVVCSILLEEGFLNCARFLERHPDFVNSKTSPHKWPAEVPWQGGNIFVDPSETHTDGYQIVSIERIEGP